MASLRKETTQIKSNGVVYTPLTVITTILDFINYNSSLCIINKKIVDPSCGDGQFLLEIVRRMIKYLNTSVLEQNLYNVYGYDIDENSVKQCITNLNNLLKENNIQLKINWNIKCQDYLKNEIVEVFYYIVGNPPYVRIQNLELEYRKFIKENFIFCSKGNTDIYIAFYERSINLLDISGKCCFVTPNSYLFNKCALDFRTYLKSNKLLVKIINYDDVQLFDNVTTYCAITLIDKSQSKNEFEYIKNNAITNISYNILDDNLISNSFNNSNTLLKDIINIHVGITTLYDKGYIFDVIKEENNCYVVNTPVGIRNIEVDICFNILKVSKLKNENDVIQNNRVILFPYVNVKGKYILVEEIIMKNNYPNAYNYLLEIKSILDKRDNGKINKSGWYAYSRNQGLNTVLGKKLIFSPMNISPNFIKVENPNTLVYSGYYIKLKDNVNFTYDELLKILNSQEMLDYMNNKAKPLKGGWRMYNKTLIENFIVY